MPRLWKKIKFTHWWLIFMSHSLILKRLWGSSCNFLNSTVTLILWIWSTQRNLIWYQIGEYITFCLYLWRLDECMLRLCVQASVDTSGYKDSIQLSSLQTSLKPLLPLLVAKKRSCVTGLWSGCTFQTKSTDHMHKSPSTSVWPIK